MVLLKNSNITLIINFVVFCLITNSYSIFQGLLGQELARNNLPIKIGVIGTGYVGLVLGPCLSHLGHEVICTDVDKKKIKMLNKQIVPIYEPGLDELIAQQTKNKTLVFTNNVEETIKNSDVLFVTVGTPTSNSGEADLSYIQNVAELIGKNLNSYKVICVKSTVPVGTVYKMKAIIKDLAKNQDFDVAFNPEFLREGVALNDFLKPDRIVLGTDSERALNIMKEVYSPLVNSGIPLITTDISTAETIKYAANAFLAIKISYINEISRFCDKIHADVSRVAHAIGLDSRIGCQFLKPGPGFGGSCFPKDIQALLFMAKQIGCPLNIVDAAYESNKIQKNNIVKKLEKLINEPLDKKVVAVLGLAFKANTDDIRESPAIDIIEQLLQKNAIVKTYDPIAMNNMKKIFPNIEYCSSIDSALESADALLVLTDWNEFYNMDLQKIYKLLRKPVILDARNILNTKLLKDFGFIFDNLGNAKVGQK